MDNQLPATNEFITSFLLLPKVWQQKKNAPDLYHGWGNPTKAPLWVLLLGHQWLIQRFWHQDKSTDSYNTFRNKFLNRNFERTELEAGDRYRMDSIQYWIEQEQGSPLNLRDRKKVLSSQTHGSKRNKTRIHRDRNGVSEEEMARYVELALASS